MTKPVILTGLRANNDLHIGHIFGAMNPIIDMAQKKANEFQINMFIPDLHSFTTPIDHKRLQKQIIQNLRTFVAAGLPLDHANIHIYRQSRVPAHSELAWILECFTSFGEMSRMTQFKEKSEKSVSSEVESMIESALAKSKSIRVVKNPRTGNKQPDLVLETSAGTLEVEIKRTHKSADGPSVGLFAYPVLMAADILLYDAVLVPVGDDQTQHLEFTRDIAERMNNTFGKLFTVPKPVKEQHAFFGKDQGLRIKDLADPSKKMSKSDETGKGVIFLNDTPAQAQKKIMGATTDSFGRIAYNKAEQPGLANLMDILALISGKTIGQVSKQFVGQMQYGPLKTAVADAVGDYLTDFQAKLAKVSDAAINKKLAVSEAAMNKQANQTLTKVQKAVGLR